jgi:hypothetical protein
MRADLRAVIEELTGCKGQTSMSAPDVDADAARDRVMSCAASAAAAARYLISTSP